MEDILISAVLTTYKRPVNIVKRALDSVMNQTYQNLEAVVVNDYPEDVELDGVLETLVKGYCDSRLTYVKMPHNSGACAARNYGASLSHGKYIAFLDDDDEWLPQKIELQYQAFDSDSVVMVYSPFFNVRNGKSEMTFRCRKSGNLSNEMLYNNIAGGSSMTLIRRETFDEVGGFDEEFPASQDYDLYFRIAHKGDVVCKFVPLVNRYVQENSISKNIENNQKGWDSFTRKHLNDYSGAQKALSYRYMRRVSYLFERGMKNQGKDLFREGIKKAGITRYVIIEPLKGMIKCVRIRCLKK